jgi:hypothetical protein
MMDQGAYGRAWCKICEPGKEPAEVAYDLPDPKEKQVSVDFRGGVVNISGKHGIPSEFGSIECKYLKISGDVNAGSLKVTHLDCSHSLLQVAELIGGMADSPVQEIILNDSSLVLKNDLYFLNLTADEAQRHGHGAVSRVQGGTLEGVNVSGSVLLKADRVLIVNLDANEVHVKNFEESAIGRSHCNRVFHERGMGDLVKVQPKVDSHLLQASNNYAVGESGFGEGVEHEHSIDL